MATAQQGHFVWYEHLTKDATAAIGFYGEVVGWKTQAFDPKNPAYQMWMASQGPLGGVMSAPEVPPHWIGNVCVKNVDETVAKVKSLGGNVHKEASDIPAVGRFAVLADPQGAAFAIFQPDGAMQLHDSEREGEICWNELMTSDSVSAFDFYRQIFGWKIQQEMDIGAMGTYRIFGVEDGKQLGGMMTIPKGTPMPTAWLHYVQMTDLEAALGRAKKQGAKVLNGPMEVPGGGKVVQLMDPQGAAFALHQSPKK